MATAIAANLGAICWHGPHQVAAKSTTTSCFCGVLASSLSNSAFECTECTEPLLAFERERLPPLAAALAAGLAAAGGGDGAASAGAARALGGLPGNRSRRSTRSHDCVRPVEAAGEAPPRSVSTWALRCTSCGPDIRSASALRTHRRAATTRRAMSSADRVLGMACSSHVWLRQCRMLLAPCACTGMPWSDMHGKTLRREREHARAPHTLRDNLMKHAAIVLLLAATAEALMLGTPASAVSRRCRLVSASTAPLLNALAETGPVGVDASEEQQTSIESLASALDGTGEDAAQARVPLKGTYDLMYSMAKGGSNGKVDSHWQPSHWQPSHWQP